MAFTLPALPYAYDALEPHIDAKTMEIHHSKHHQAYVNNLNAAIEKAPELANKSLDDLMRGINSVPEAVRTAVRNNGGGHWNHSMFWTILGQGGNTKPSGDLAADIDSTFGGFDAWMKVHGLAGKKIVPASSGTMPTHTPLFVALLIGTVVIVGALAFIPALALGPIVEHLMMR